jgi:hypothetical protein
MSEEHVFEQALPAAEQPPSLAKTPRSRHAPEAQSVSAVQAALAGLLLAEVVLLQPAVTAITAITATGRREVRRPHELFMASRLARRATGPIAKGLPVAEAAVTSDDRS